MYDPQFIARLQQYIAAGRARTLGAQLTHTELRTVGDLLHEAADLVDVARVDRAQLDEGLVTLAELAAVGTEGN